MLNPKILIVKRLS